MDSLIIPQRFNNAFNLGVSQMSPHGYRNSSVMSQHHQHESEMPSQTYDFNRMLQQHLSEGTSTTYRSTLHNIQEIDQDENAENPTSDSTPDQSPSMHHLNSSAAMIGSVTTGVSHREGPMATSHDRSLIHSLCAQTGYEPVSTDLTTANMCLSTLYLHELYHRQSRRRSGSNIRMQSTNAQQQQNLWQLPHRDPPNAGAQMPSSQTSHTRTTPPADTRSAAEKTPLLYPKKT